MPEPQAALPSGSVWLRYWTFGWMLPVANGDLFAQAAARRGAQRRLKRWLPVYLQRYATMIAALLGLLAIERAGDAHPLVVAATALPLSVFLGALIFAVSFWAACEVD
jgi:hypothetical protein